jgi:hypothetical protein
MVLAGALAERLPGALAALEAGEIDILRAGDRPRRRCARGDERTLDQIRADAAIDLLTGPASGALLDTVPPPTGLLPASPAMSNPGPIPRPGLRLPRLRPARPQTRPSQAQVPR